MGMLATVINGLALQDALESLGCQTRLLTAIRMDGVAEPYIRRRAKRHLEKGRIVHSRRGNRQPVRHHRHGRGPAGTGDSRPTFCSKRPALTACSPTIRRRIRTPFSIANYRINAVREQNLRVMDPTAIAQCMEHNMPILVFNFKKERNIERAVNGERVGTMIGG